MGSGFRPGIFIHLLLAALLLVFFLGCTTQKSAAGNSKSTPSTFEILRDPKASFREKRAFVMARLLGDPEWEKRWWIERTHRLLRGGEGLSASEDIEVLAQKSEDDILDSLLQDTRFANTVLDFNMNLLGFKEDNVKLNGKYNPIVYGYPGAVRSAINVLSGKDYLTVFDFYRDDYYMGPLIGLDPMPGEDPSLSSEARRKMRMDQSQVTLQSLIDKGRLSSTLSSKDYCDEIQQYIGAVQTQFGLSLDLVFHGWLFNPNGLLDLQFACFGNPPPVPDLVVMLEKVYKFNDQFFAEVRKFEPSQYPEPGDINQIRQLDLDAVQIPKPWLGLSFNHMIDLPNSSTNQNRKRANYILKQFFCDDMTPIAVEQPTQHTSGPHGSETSCYACHYKLDPMAGFFRNYGVIFIDFSKMPTLIFDDRAVVDRKKYTDNWLAPAGSGRTYDIGYIRSVSNPADNEYGESLQDLSKILRKSPETNRCLVKRMFEYFVAPDQMIDAGYLTLLSQQFAMEAQADSSLAFKNTVRRIVKSNSFKNTNMDPTQCYDFPPGGVSADSPPCRVAYILEQNCTQCHDTTGAKGRLDLTRWIQLPDGKYTFPHLDSAGAQKPRRDTLDGIISRLSSTDPELRMPYKKMMTSQERQELYLWLQGLPN